MSTVEIATKAREYRELQCFIKQLEEEAEALKAAIMTEMEARHVNTMQADVFTVRLIEYQTSRLDAKALRAEAPELADRYTKITTGRRFQIA